MRRSPKPRTLQIAQKCVTFHGPPPNDVPVRMRTMPAPTYRAPAKLFHWLTVLLLTIQYAMGLLMPDRFNLSIGALIVICIALRLLWHRVDRGPSEPHSLPPLLRWITRAIHWLLDGLLVAFPLMGWANASSLGWPVSLFGIVPLPTLSARGSPLGRALGDAHKLTAWILIVVVTLHVAIALYRHFIVNDDTLRRMTPTRRT
jgi:cytochrome b561